MTAQRFRIVVAAHLLLVRDGRVLLLKRANTGYEDGNYSVPAGHLDGGETVTRAAIREAAEEVGIALEPQDVVHALVMHRRDAVERIDFFVTATAWGGEPTNHEPDKCDELQWAEFSDLPANTIPYIRRGIEAFRAGERYVEFGWD